MPEAKPCAEWRARPLYWSTIAYQRAWWATDGAHLALVREDQGLRVKLLRRIGDEYRVNRWIPGKNKSRVIADDDPGIADDPSAGRYCELLNDARVTWPEGLVNRAEACEAIVCRARSTGVSASSLVSATTKFMWFLRPERWTVFDRLACKGMGIDPEKGKAAARMHAFYARLESAGFDDLVDRMEAIIAPTMLRGLPAPRILDTLFMGRAGGDCDDLAIRRLGAFRDLLPPPLGAALTTLAEALHGAFGTHPLSSHEAPA